MKKAAFLDIDGTLHEGFITPNFIFHLYDQGILDEEVINAFDTFLNKDPRRYTNYSEWAPELTLKINSIFKGRSRNTIAKYLKMYEKVIERNLYSFTLPLIQLLKENKFELFLVSGAHDFLAELIADLFEISYTNVIAAKLVEKDGKFTEEMLLGSHVATEKKEAIIELKESFDLSKSIVLGDATSDIKLFPLVGKGFLFIDNNSHNSLLKQAREFQGIIVDKTEKTENILNIIESNLP